MQFIDQLIAGIAPTYAIRRLKAKHAVSAYYEASRPSRTRRNMADNSSGNLLTDGAAETLRGQARHLDQNHDLAKGTLRELVNKTSGAKGIQVESLARTPDGNIARDFTRAINDLWNEWTTKCDAAGEMSFAQMQRQLLHSKYRDGEAFERFLSGKISGLTHNTGVPFSVQGFEADFVPYENDENKGIYQGIKRDAWGRAKEYRLLTAHPSETFGAKTFGVDALDMCHPKLVDRIGQGRGVSIFASVLNRLNDLKDYEDSERTAARISASMAAFIKKGNADLYDEDAGDEERDVNIENGMIFDGLLPGEDVGTIESNRPSQLLQPFRDSMLKAIATGTGAGYSPVSNDYSGTYASQRQQLIDNWVNYEVLQDAFIAEVVRPTYRRFVSMAINARLVSTAGVDMATVYDADYRGPVMPWIDPKKEADAHITRLAAGLTSPQKMMRNAGENPQEVVDQVKAYVEMLEKADLPKPEYLPSKDNDENE